MCAPTDGRYGQPRTKRPWRDPPHRLQNPGGWLQWVAVAQLMPVGEQTVSNKPSTAEAGGQSRRSFLVKLGLGAGVLGALASPLAGLSRQKSAAASQEFPGPDSIFHPAADPRLDPRRRSS